MWPTSATSSIYFVQRSKLYGKVPGKVPRGRLSRRKSLSMNDIHDEVQRLKVPPHSPRHRAQSHAIKNLRVHSDYVKEDAYRGPVDRDNNTHRSRLSRRASLSLNDIVEKCNSFASLKSKEKKGTSCHSKDGGHDDHSGKMSDISIITEEAVCSGHNKKKTGHSSKSEHDVKSKSRGKKQSPSYRPRMRSDTTYNSNHKCHSRTSSSTTDHDRESFFHRGLQRRRSLSMNDLNMQAGKEFLKVSQLSPVFERHLVHQNAILEARLLRQSPVFERRMIRDTRNKSRESLGTKTSLPASPDEEHHVKTDVAISQSNGTSFNSHSKKHSNEHTEDDCLTKEKRKTEESAKIASYSPDDLQNCATSSGRKTSKEKRGILSKLKKLVHR